jgi:TolB-like protein
MTAERWLQVESVAVRALEQPADRRTAFLEESCGADSALRSEVESLLAYEGAADNFLPRPALDEAARIFAARSASDPVDWHIPGYAVSELLGAGGMGEVYRARDTRLDRDVAIKVLPAATGHQQATARFEEEARAASALNHPNIVTIYAVGNQEDLAYIVMELVAGRTLRALLAEGELPQARALDVAVQLAEGLASAHAAGIVHRDLKPENVMVTDEGLVKILDFGIASRRQREAAESDQPVRVSPGVSTRYGRIAGTVGYMAPEQAAGGSVDYRADQFSFGAILAEMNGDRQATGSLVDLIERCLSDNPEQRYETTRELAVALRGIRDRSLHDLHRTGLSRRRAIWLGGATIVATAGGIAGVRWLRGATAPRRLAVLSFTNSLHDEASQYLCDGIAEVLIRQLTPMPALAVIARSIVFNLRGRTDDPREVGRQLGVDEILTGSVERRGGRALVHVELVDANSGNRIWGDEFDRPEGDVLAIQEEIAAAIITAGLQLTLTGAESRQLRRSLTAEPEAYRLFLLGIHHFRLEGETNYRTAQHLLSQAVGRDAGFTLALLTLASTYSAMAVDGYMAPGVAWPQSHDYVTRVLEQDGTLADAHGERAVEAFMWRWDWATAQQEWNKALNSPRSGLQPEFLTAYALYQWALGHTAEALRFAHDARAADRLSPMLAIKEADLLVVTGQHDAAAALYTKVIEDNHGEQAAYFGLAEARRAQGRFDDAIDLWHRIYAGDETLDEMFETARGVEGYNDLARALAERELVALTAREQSGAYASPLDIARAHARLGRSDDAFRYLKKAFDERSPGLVFLNVDRAWDNVRSELQFGAAVRRVGLA